MRIAIYARVSTDEQDGANQLHALRQYAVALNIEPVEFSDVISGRTESRPALDDMLSRIRAGEFNTLLTWTVSRLGRDAAHTLSIRRELKKLGVRIVVLGDGIDTERDGSVMLFGIRAVIAEVERETISKNTRLALRRARAEGITLGRPRKTVDIRQGESIREAARRLNVSAMTIIRRRREVSREATL